MIEPRKIAGGLGNRMFQMAYLLAEQAKGNIPDIYLQDEKYFENIKDQIKEIYGKGIARSDYVSLHIRRGDYVNNPFYVDLTKTDYYDKAIAKFPNDNFFVFCADRQGNDTADQDWVMKWLSDKIGTHRFILKVGNNEVEDFNQMAGCKGHIMANSSFSWWAAYVGSGRNVAPSQWFSNGTRLNYPSNWEII